MLHVISQLCRCVCSLGSQDATSSSFNACFAPTPLTQALIARPYAKAAAVTARSVVDMSLALLYSTSTGNTETVAGYL